MNGRVFVCGVAHLPRSYGHAAAWNESRFH